MKRQVVNTERAHFMCPNMHYGILVTITSEFKENKIRKCLDELAYAHSFLRSVMAFEEDGKTLYYKDTQQSKVEFFFKDSDNSIWEDYENIGKEEWNVFEHGLLKVFIYPKQEEMKVLFVAHHLLGDGRCLLEITQELADCYVLKKQPIVVEEQLIGNINDLPKNSKLPLISRWLVKHLNEKWKKENKTISYQEYKNFYGKFQKKNPVGYEVVDGTMDDLKKMEFFCKQNEVSINDLLMAKTYLVINVDKIVMAADIRTQLACYKKGAYGNYATAMGVTVKRNKCRFEDFVKQVQKKIQSLKNSNQKLMCVLACYLVMNKQLIDAAVVATMGDFKSKAAAFVGGNMFGYVKRNGVSITNLGKVKSETLKDAIFIPPASPAMKQTFGVVTVNNQMKICCSFYEDKIPHDKVKEQLKQMIMEE